MTIKLLEIRDRHTFIPAMAVKVCADDGYLMRRAGFGNEPMVYLIALATEHCKYDPYNWDNRTMRVAHLYIAQSFDSLQQGDVVDVEFILGETPAAKLSEQLTVT
jgi:hypothetical protein